MKTVIHTAAAPAAIGTYSQAVRHGDLVFLSGQIPLDPATMEVVDGGIAAQVRRVFDNLSAVCEAAGGGLDNILKLNVFLTDMGDFPVVNEIMGEYFTQPYPARAAVGVAALPRGVVVEMEAVLAANA
ncbi:RidA family protein [Marinihelvus fidelis]|uniref:RidA family protein n=1 Tax=Marinihelvus fidelis TaxID=2613842 RepID=A0A5N0T934_9GAMM|nr:RidA family protein [Marinihelvus fidelis]KAA9131281.1 RidA family protein [Marinihelvus fidelis]